MNPIDGHLPEVKQRRHMLENALEQVRTQGYDAQISLMVTEVQIGTHVAVQAGNGFAKKEKKAHLRDLEDTIKNAKLVAARLQRELAALPDEPEEPEEPAEEPEA